LKSLDSLSDAALEQLVNSLLRLKANPDPQENHTVGDCWE